MRSSRLVSSRERDLEHLRPPRLVHAELREGHRREHFVLCFSEGAVWLLDDDLGICCRQRLPFNATFAHVVYSTELSTAVIASKFEPSESHLWAVTVVRRRRSLRFRLRVQRLPVTNGLAHAWPTGVIIGAAFAPGARLLTLQANRRLHCLGLAVGVDCQSEPEAGYELR